jgi:hypothetical protein
MVVYSGIANAIEYKIHQSRGAYNFDGVKPHQIKGLLDSADSGPGRGLIILNVRIQGDKLPDDYDLFERGSHRGINVCYGIDVAAYLKMKKMYIEEHAGRKSMPLAEIKVYWTEIKRKHFMNRINKQQLFWDVEPYLKNLPVPEEF